MEYLDWDNFHVSSRDGDSDRISCQLSVLPGLVSAGIIQPKLMILVLSLSSLHRGGLWNLLSRTKNVWQFNRLGYVDR